jgi:hypothetical protein
LSAHAIIAPHPNLLLVASGDLLLDYDQMVIDFAAWPEERRQAFLQAVLVNAIVPGEGNSTDAASDDPDHERKIPGRSTTDPPGRSSNNESNDSKSSSCFWSCLVS